MQDPSSSDALGPSWLLLSLVTALVAAIVTNTVVVVLLFKRGAATAEPLAVAVPATPKSVIPRNASPKRQTPRSSRVAPPPPTSSLADAVEQIRVASVEQRYARAGDLLDEVQTMLSDGSDLGFGSGGAKMKLDELLSDGVLEERIRLARTAVEDLSSDHGFGIVREDANMRVSQRMTADRVLTVKIEGQLEGVRPADIIMIWREVQLYPAWFPFVTKGALLADRAPGEVWLKIFVETFAMDVQMPLWGFASDHLDSSDGSLLLIVRPVRPDTALPPNVSMEASAGKSTRKLFGTMVAYAVIDILIEPVSDSACRFAFQMSDTVPPWAPSWMINYVIQHALTNVYDQTRMIAEGMARNDPACPHVAHIARPEYAPTKRWLEDKVKKYLGATAPPTPNGRAAAPELNGHANGRAPAQNGHAPAPNGHLAPPPRMTATPYLSPTAKKPVPDASPPPSWVYGLLEPCLGPAGSPRATH